MNLEQAIVRPAQQGSTVQPTPPISPTSLARLDTTVLMAPPMPINIHVRKDHTIQPFNRRTAHRVFFVMEANIAQ